MSIPFRKSALFFLTLACLGRWAVAAADNRAGAAPSERPSGYQTATF